MSCFSLRACIELAGCYQARNEIPTETPWLSNFDFKRSQAITRRKYGLLDLTSFATCKSLDAEALLLWDLTSLLCKQSSLNSLKTPKLCRANSIGATSDKYSAVSRAPETLEVLLNSSRDRDDFLSNNVSRSRCDAPIPCCINLRDDRVCPLSKSNINCEPLVRLGEALDFVLDDLWISIQFLRHINLNAHSSMLLCLQIFILINVSYDSDTPWDLYSISSLPQPEPHKPRLLYAQGFDHSLLYDSDTSLAFYSLLFASNIITSYDSDMPLMSYSILIAHHPSFSYPQALFLVNVPYDPDKPLDYSGLCTKAATRRGIGLNRIVPVIDARGLSAQRLTAPNRTWKTSTKERQRSTASSLRFATIPSHSERPQTPQEVYISSQSLKSAVLPPQRLHVEVSGHWTASEEIRRGQNFVQYRHSKTLDGMWFSLRARHIFNLVPAGGNEKISGSTKSKIAVSVRFKLVEKSRGKWGRARAFLDQEKARIQGRRLADCRGAVKKRTVLSGMRNMKRNQFEYWNFDQNVLKLECRKKPFWVVTA
ncbi:hypothetical protein C8J57DRAFT_1240929 [Mycena rebaudengoi]|nr:hypothetical protein C8J57DRAFT_1240929 [Mycena rebaudengoi]